MSNSHKAVQDDPELTLYLGTYWFDFEQAAELAEAALSAGEETCKDKTPEDPPPHYVI